MRCVVRYAELLAERGQLTAAMKYLRLVSGATAAATDDGVLAALIDRLVRSGAPNPGLAAPAQPLWGAAGGAPGRRPAAPAPAPVAQQTAWPGAYQAAAAPRPGVPPAAAYAPGVHTPAAAASFLPTPGPQFISTPPAATQQPSLPWAPAAPAVPTVPVPQPIAAAAATPATPPPPPKPMENWNDAPWVVPKARLEPTPAPTYTAPRQPSGVLPAVPGAPPIPGPPPPVGMASPSQQPQPHVMRPGAAGAPAIIPPAGPTFISAAPAAPTAAVPGAYGMPAALAAAGMPAYGAAYPGAPPAGPGVPPGPRPAPARPSPAPQPERKKKTPGDRSKIPPEHMPIFKGFSDVIAKAEQRHGANPQAKAYLDGLKKRLNVLFDQLNDHEVAPPVIAHLQSILKGAWRVPGPGRVGRTPWPHSPAADRVCRYIGTQRWRPATLTRRSAPTRRW